MKRFLLVCEGPSDIALLEKIGDALRVQVIEFSPKADATTGRYPNHGWTEVMNWCKSIGARPTKGNPIDLLLAFRKADGLIIQIDTDIANLINIGGKLGTSGCKTWTQNGIDNWLGRHCGHNKVHYLLCRHSSENWIVATYPNYRIGFKKGALKDYESIANPQEILINLGYKKKSGQLLKNYNQYTKENYAPRIVKHLSKARVRCAELNKFISLCL